MSTPIYSSVNPAMASGVCCPELRRQHYPKPALETLRTLSLTPLEPHWHHTSPSTLSRLRRVEKVHVVRSSSRASCAKSQEYVVNIYYEEPQSHIPTVIWSQRARTARHPVRTASHDKPDLQVTHTLSQFCSLRNNVHACIETDYRTSHCNACQRLGRFMTSGGGRPLAFGSVTLDATQDASILLTVFVNSLLDECQPTPDQASDCHAQHHIAIVLQEFLFRS